MTKQTRTKILLVTGGVVAGASVPVGITIANSVNKQKESLVRSSSSVYSEKEIDSAISSEVANYYASNPTVGKNVVLEAQVQDRVKRQVANLDSISETQLREIINSELSSVFSDFSKQLDALLTTKLQQEREQQIDIIYNSYSQIYDKLKERIDQAVKDNKELADEGKWIVDWKNHASVRPKIERKDVLYKEQLTDEIAKLNDLNEHFQRVEDITRWALKDYSAYKQKLAAMQYGDIAKRVSEVHFDLWYTFAGVTLEPEIEKEVGPERDVNIPTEIHLPFMTEQEIAATVQKAQDWLVWAEKRLDALRNQKYADGIAHRYPNKVVEDVLIIPSWVTRLPYRTFSGFTFKNRLFVPENIQVIGKEAFYKANFEQGLWLSPGLIEIEEAGMAEANVGDDEHAFRLPYTVQKLGTRAFAYTDLPQYFTVYAFQGDPTIGDVFEDSLTFKTKTKNWVAATDIDDKRIIVTARKVKEATGKDADTRRWFVDYKTN